MNTMMHLAGIISSLMIAFFCLVLVGGGSDAVLPQARYLGWAFVVIALMLIPGMIIAMRYDFIYPLGDDA